MNIWACKLEREWRMTDATERVWSWGCCWVPRLWCWRVVVSPSLRGDSAWYYNQGADYDTCPAEGPALRIQGSYGVLLTVTLLTSRLHDHLPASAFNLPTFTLVARTNSRCLPILRKLFRSFSALMATSYHLPQWIGFRCDQRLHLAGWSRLISHTTITKEEFDRFSGRSVGGTQSLSLCLQYLRKTKRAVWIIVKYATKLWGVGRFLSQKRSESTLKNTPRETASEYGQMKKLENPVPTLAKKISMTSTGTECQREAWVGRYADIALRMKMPIKAQ